MESNLPLGKEWLKTCKHVEQKTLVPVIAGNVLCLLYIALHLSAMQHLKRGENDFSKGLKMKKLLPFLWVLAHPMPAQCPPVQQSPC